MLHWIDVSEQVWLAITMTAFRHSTTGTCKKMVPNILNLRKVGWRPAKPASQRGHSLLVSFKPVNGSIVVAPDHTSSCFVDSEGYKYKYRL